MRTYLIESFFQNRWAGEISVWLECRANRKNDRVSVKRGLAGRNADSPAFERMKAKKGNRSPGANGQVSAREEVLRQQLLRHAPSRQKGRDQIVI